MGVCAEACRLRDAGGAGIERGFGLGPQVVHHGSSLESLLAEDDLLDEASLIATKKVIAAQIAAAMCGMMPRVQPNAATTLARLPRERPAASV